MKKTYAKERKIVKSEKGTQKTKKINKEKESKEIKKTGENWERNK